MTTSRKATALGPPASHGHSIKSHKGPKSEAPPPLGRLAEPQADQHSAGISAQPISNKGPVSPLSADDYTATPDTFSARNSTISTNSTSTHKPTGGFGPANPWRFQPGHSGNPKGRPRRSKQKPLSDVLRDLLARPSTLAPQKSHADLIGELILKAALDGNFRAISALFDRIEGRPAHSIAFQTPSPLQSDDWIRLRDAICAALEPFPDARAAVIRAIDEINAEIKTNADND